jgi:hypothetical protein
MRYHYIYATSTLISTFHNDRHQYIYVSIEPIELDSIQFNSSSTNSCSLYNHWYDTAIEIEHPFEAKLNEPIQKNSLLPESLQISIPWQQRFIDILLLPATNSNEKLYKFQQLRTLTNEFMNIAKQCAQIIVWDSVKPEAQRTIQPVKGKGIGKQFTSISIYFNEQLN